MSFYKAIIGSSFDETEEKKPASAIYFAAINKEAVEKAFTEKKIFVLFRSDKVLKIEEVNQTEVEQHCAGDVTALAKRLVETGIEEIFYIGSKKLF